MREVTLYDRYWYNGTSADITGRDYLARVNPIVDHKIVTGSCAGSPYNSARLSPVALWEQSIAYCRYLITYSGKQVNFGSIIDVRTRTRTGV